MLSIGRVSLLISTNAEGFSIPISTNADVILYQP